MDKEVTTGKMKKIISSVFIIPALTVINTNKIVIEVTEVFHVKFLIALFLVMWKLHSKLL